MKNSKSRNYFDSFINQGIALKERSNLKLQQGQINMSRIHLIRYMWFTRDFRILIAKYSRGDELSSIKIDFVEILKQLEIVWTPKTVKLKNDKGEYYDLYMLDCYIYMRWMLSLCILLDMNNSYVLQLAELIKRDNVNDRLYDFLISSRFEDWELSEALALQKPKNRIVEIIDIQDKERCEKELKTYLEKEWYKTYKNFGFNDSHKEADERLLFYGYWAFEVAAVVKIKGLDDSSFRDNKYYPSDLV